jgi:tetratricopeptide (TPR) repeat protein
VLWATLLAMGDPAAAIVHIERGQRLYADGHGAQPLLFSPHDAGTCALDHLALARWLLGYPEAALAAAREARTLAERQRHPILRTYGTLPRLISRCARMWVHYYRGDLADARECAQRVVAVSTAHGFSGWLDDGTVVLACLAGDDDRMSMRALYERLRAGGPGRAAWRNDHCLCVLAGAAAAAGDVDLGFEILDAIPEDRRDAFFAPEIERIRGELLVARGDRGQAERCFRRAMQSAQSRGERSLELRATVSLARLLAGQRRRAEASSVLGELYAAFTEGFETADLRAARSLLDQLQPA